MGLVFNGTNGADKISAVDGTLTIDGVATIDSITSPIITGDLSISDKIIHTGDTNTALRFPTADTITAEVGGSEITRVTSSGLGINVTPNRELHVKGLDAIVRVESTSATGRNVIEFFDSSAAKGSIGWPASGNDHMAIQQSENADMWFSTNDTERLRITSDGVLKLVGQTTVRETAGLTHHTNGNLYIRGGATGVILQSVDENEAIVVQNTYITAVTNGGERLRIDSSGRLLVGHNASDPMFYTGRIQVQGTNSSTSAITVKTNQNDSGGPAIVLGKSRGSVGTQTIVQSGDELGSIYWNGADGTDTNSYASAIRCNVDGTPGSNDMPGRLLFMTTADGASTSTERLRITSNGQIFIANEAGSIDTTARLGEGHRFQLSGLSSNDGFSVVRYNTSYGPWGFNMGRSKSGTLGTNTIVQNHNDLGHITFWGADGTDFNQACQISGAVDGTPSDGTDMPGRLVFKTTPDGSGTPVERLRIDSSGDIGLGISTPNLSGYGSPVVSLGHNSSNNYSVLELTGNKTSNTGTNAPISTIVGYNVGGASRIAAINFCRYNANNNGAITFETYSSGSAGERLLIDSSGQIYARSNATQYLILGSSGQATSGGPHNNQNWIRGNGNNLQLNCAANGFFGIENNGTERLRITSDGRTELRKDNTCLRLLPTTSGASVYMEFYDDGNSSRQGFIGFGSNTETTSTMHMHNNMNGHLEFRANNTVHFRINSNGDLQGTDTSISSLSDSRLKKNVADFVYDLSKFKQFKPKTFEWINTDKHSSGTQRGFIAQDLEGVDAELTGESSLDTELQASDITTLGSDKAKTARLGKNDTIYVSVIQQLITKIETLETKVAALESA